MTKPVSLDQYEVGYDIPAAIGMDEREIQTPCLILDLDALERNIVKMGDYAKAHGMRHRVHGKMHKSVDVALLQERLGGAVGVCCQKVSEAEVFARGGIKGCAGVEPGARPGQAGPAGTAAKAWARGCWSASMISTTWPNCPRRRRATARNSNA